MARPRDSIAIRAHDRQIFHSDGVAMASAARQEMSREVEAYTQMRTGERCCGTRIHAYCLCVLRNASVPSAVVVLDTWFRVAKFCVTRAFRRHEQTRDDADTAGVASQRERYGAGGKNGLDRQQSDPTRKSMRAGACRCAGAWMCICMRMHVGACGCMYSAAWEHMRPL
eukprot:353923-Chlamydomonas_euryale.AAC.2